MRFEQDVVVTGRSVEEVFAYVSDFNRAHEWRTEVTASTMEPAGPMKLGSRLHEVARVNGRTVVTDSVVDDLVAPYRFTFAHVSGPLPVSGEYRFATTDGGTRLTYVLEVELTGVWRLMAPVLRRSGRRTIARSLTTLAERLG
jgi:carbon monoxide dehydrogenase subunit G